MSETSKPFAASHSLDRAFFLAFAAISIVAVAGGFLPKLGSIFSGERDWPPFAVHVHAVLFYGWIALLTTQVLLVRNRNTGLHKRLGYLGLVLAVAMVVVGAWMALSMAEWHLARGVDRSLNFLPVPLMDLVIFAVLVTAAGLRRADSPAHKRLILLATTQLLGAGFGRMQLYSIPPTPWFPPMQMFVDLYGLLWVIMALAIGFDVMTRGRPHPVYGVAVPFMLVMQFAAACLLLWPGWRAFASALGIG